MRINLKKALSDKFKKVPFLFVVIIFIALSLSLYRSVVRMGKANVGISEARERVDKLKEENRKLEEEIKKVRNIEFIEKQLRDKLGLAKEGEIVVVLPEDDVLRKLAPEIEEEEETLPDPNWKKWMRLFDL